MKDPIEQKHSNEPSVTHGVPCSDCEAFWFRASNEVQDGYIRGLDSEGVKGVRYGVIDDLAIFEGDIVLGNTATMAQIRAEVEGDSGSADPGTVKRGIGITGQRFRWPNGLVPWVSTAPLRPVVQQAIAHWETNTRIRFVERTAANQVQFTNFISFEALGGCSSNVGMQGNGMQQISLSAGCGFPQAVHEIGHAVGLFHEQSREDRDNNIRIIWANIQPGQEHNFNQQISDGDDLGDYDFGSIMHYGPTAFGINGAMTIEVLHGQTIGQRNGLSAGDIAAVRALYPELEPSASRQAWHNEQTASGISAGWSDWHELSHPGNCAKRIAMAAHSDGRMHAIMIGLDDQLWHNEQSASGVSALWTDWSVLSHPGNKAKAVALAAHGDGRMHAVMIGLDNQLWHNEQTASGVSASWSDWRVLSHTGNKAKAVALAAHPDGRMHAVMIGLDDQLWHNEQTASGVSALWTDWSVLSHPGNKAKAVALAAHGNGRMHAVMIGLDNQLWHNEQTASGVSASWSDWRVLSHTGNKAKAVALAAHPDGRMHAVMIGLDDQLWHNEQTASGVSALWTDWSVLSHPGNKARLIALTVHADGRMHAAMAGMDDQLWHNEQIGTGVSAMWTDWQFLSHASNKAKAIALAAHPDGRIHASMAGLD